MLTIIKEQKKKNAFCLKTQGTGNPEFQDSPLLGVLYLIVSNYSFPQRENKLLGDSALLCALPLLKASAEDFRVMRRMLLHLSVLTLSCVWATAMEIPMSTVVKETLTQLSAHRALLTSNEVKYNLFLQLCF
jgi:hypothetical protein